MENLGRIKCVVDVGENSIEIDPYVVDFFFEPVFLSGMYPDMKCTAQIIGLDQTNPPLIKVDIVSNRRGERYDALRVTSEELFSKPCKFSIVFGFDSEKLQSPLQLEAEVEVRHAGTPIVARIHSGLPTKFEGSVSSDLSGVNSRLRSELAMTFWDWPLENARLELKANETWLEHSGKIEVLSGGGKEGPRVSTELSEEFREVDFSALKPLILPKEGFPNAPYHSYSYIILRLGSEENEFPVVGHLVDSRQTRRRTFGRIAELEDPDAWPYFLWRGAHFKEQPNSDKFLIRKGRLWEGFTHLDPDSPGNIKRVQHERYTSAVPTRAWFGHKGDEFIVNWFHLDEYGWKVRFE
tara:strand:- start:4412 stop:5467 length:1056 start_codon:yes stop_codon:yes gene_type:complete